MEGKRRGREGKGRGWEREGSEERGGERDLAPRKKSWRHH